MFTAKDPLFFAMLIYVNVVSTITFVFYAWYFKQQTSSCRYVFFEKKYADLIAMYAKVGDFPLLALLPICYETNNAILGVNIFTSWITFIIAVRHMKFDEYDFLRFIDCWDTLEEFPNVFMRYVIGFYVYTWYIIPAIMVNVLFVLALAPFVCVGCCCLYCAVKNHINLYM